MEGCVQEVIDVSETDDCYSETYGLTSDDIDCLKNEQWLNDKVLLETDAPKE